MLQQVLNPPAPGKVELAHGGSTLRVGDRVIQQVNDYQREVFNGDVGTIASIDLEEQEIVVQFAERAMTYDYADLTLCRTPDNLLRQIGSPVAPNKRPPQLASPYRMINVQTRRNL
jgi:hypothetical protein